MISVSGLKIEYKNGGAEPDPVGVYFRICGLNTNVKWIRGNHDHLLAKYIYTYYGTVPKKRSSLHPYRYNSFDLMKDRLTEADMLNLADQIMDLPLHIQIDIGSEKYDIAKKWDEGFYAEIPGLSYNSIDFLFNRKLSDIEIETLLGEYENIHADAACSGGYE